MKKTLLLSLAATAAATTASFASFTAGDLVVYRVGTGTGTLSSASQAIFLDEYTTAGSLVQSIAIPTTGTNMLTSNGTASSEGFLNLSPDGSYLTVPGYSATTGVTAINGTTAAANPRAALIYDSTGAVTNEVTFTGQFSAGNIRSAVSLDGTNAYATGSNTGLVYNSTIISTTGTNLRVGSIQGGQLYTSTSSGALRLATVGTGTPTTSPQTAVNLPGFPTSGGSPYAYAFADLSTSVSGLDTLYVADDGGSAGIQKYSLVGGNWTLNGTVTASSVRGLTLSVNATTGAVSLFGSTGGTGATGGGTLYAFTDLTGYNGAFSGTATSIATASTNEAFRGIAYTPGTSVNIVFVSVPEPQEYAVALAGLLGVVIFVRRRKAAQF